MQAYVYLLNDVNVSSYWAHEIAPQLTNTVGSSRGPKPFNPPSIVATYEWAQLCCCLCALCTIRLMDDAMCLHITPPRIWIHTTFYLSSAYNTAATQLFWATGEKLTTSFLRLSTIPASAFRFLGRLFCLPTRKKAVSDFYQKPI